MLTWNLSDRYVDPPDEWKLKLLGWRFRKTPYDAQMRSKPLMGGAGAELCRPPHLLLGRLRAALPLRVFARCAARRGAAYSAPTMKRIRGPKALAASGPSHIKARHRSLEMIRQMRRMLDLGDLLAQARFQERQAAQIGTIAGGRRSHDRPRPAPRGRLRRATSAARRRHRLCALSMVWPRWVLAVSLPRMNQPGAGPRCRLGGAQAQGFGQAAEQARRVGAHEGAPARPDAAGGMGDGRQPRHRIGIGHGVIVDGRRARQQA